MCGKQAIDSKVFDVCLISDEIFMLTVPFYCNALNPTLRRNLLCTDQIFLVPFKIRCVYVMLQGISRLFTSFTFIKNP